MKTLVAELLDLFEPEEEDPETTGIGEAIYRLAEHIDKIEARQRGNEVHDPDCPAFVTAKRQRGTGVYLTPQPCTCWLSEPVETPPPSDKPERPLRLKGCVENWPECHDDGYDPRCCRFPKSCSPYPYPEQVAAGTVELEERP